MQNKIIIRGAREHNLKNIDLELPRNEMIVFTGLSGSGKSSLAFDTIFAEGQRRYIESLSSYARQFLGGMQKPDVDEIEGLSPAISIDQKAHSSNPRSTVATITEIYDYLRVLFARVGEPHCPVCGTRLEKMSVDEMTLKIDEKITAEKEKGELLILSPVVRGRKGEYYQMLYDLYNSGFAEVRVDGKFKSLRNKLILSRYQQHTIEVVIDKIPVMGKILGDKEIERRLNEALETAIDLSNGLATAVYPDKKEQIFSTEYSCPHDGYSFPEIEPRLFSFNSPYGYCEACDGLGTKELFSEKICPKCHGKRLSDNALAVKIKNKNIWEITDMTIARAIEFFEKIDAGLSAKNKEIVGTVMHEIKSRLKFMHDVGLHYLTLNRRAGTLSGGEAQRIRLASQVGTKLVGALYVLDEPTIGLHQRDNEKLVGTLRELCDAGNTIIVVEHDEDTILASDWIADIGPAAGKHGGEIIFSGPTEEILKNPKNNPPAGGQNSNSNCKIFGDPDKSLTGKYLRGEIKIPVPKDRRNITSAVPRLKIKGATENNLKNIHVEIPLRRFVCLTGVSGSGKSTLMHKVLYENIINKKLRLRRPAGKCKEILGEEYIDNIIKIDQSPIGRTSRSNPATYTKAFDHIRELFAETPEARMRGYGVGRFSFNVPASASQSSATAGNALDDEISQTAVGGHRPTAQTVGGHRPTAQTVGGHRPPKRSVGGRCENCEGKGVLTIEMHFLPDVEVVCDVCKGKRFNKETLQVHYNGKNISDILNMTIAEAEDFFRDIPFIYDKLKILNEVGLDYLTLGQSATTLSGGEAQRIKLSRELARRGTTRTLYLLDEPTVGLHYDDVRKLLEVLQRLVSQGNTVMVIEHNLDVIKCADWIIDLGPEGGDLGGEVVTVGTPEELARRPKSWTGQYLKKVLK